MAIYGSNGSGWVKVASGDLKASNGSGWATVKKAYRSTGSGWGEVYVGSDPQTYTFIASGSKAARGISWKTNSNQGGADYPQISRYTSDSPAGTKRYPWFGLITFTNDTSGVSLTTRLNERPYVKSAYFNIRRWTSGGFGDGYGNLYIGKYNGSFTASSPHHGNCDFSAYASKNWPGGGNPPFPNVYYNDNFLSRGEYVDDPGTFSGFVADNGIELGNVSSNHRQTLVDHLKTKAICLSHTTNAGSSTGGLGHYASATYAEEANYWNFFPAGKTNSSFGVHEGPTLIIELDYIP